MRTKANHKFISLAVAGILVSGMSIAPACLAASLQEQVSVIPERTTSADAERIMSRSAAKILRHIADARAAIHAKDNGKAKSDLKQARTLIDILKSQQPTAKVRDHIWVAKQHLSYESTREVKTDLIPIEADLAEIEDFVPVAASRAHVRSSRDHMDRGDMEGAKKELDAAAAALIYSEVDLPLASTERQVSTAQNALDNKQPQAAEKALKQAEAGVLYLSTTVSEPVTRARQSLWQATKDYTAHDYVAVKADLERAGRWLDKAALSTDKVTREEAGKLKQRLSSLKGKIDQADDATGSSLTNLWQRSKALAEHQVEKVSIGWDKLHGNSPTKSNLIDAKLHLAFAESDQFIYGTSPSVGIELTEARDYLDKAAQTADQTIAGKIQTMKSELKNFKANPDDKSAQARAHYEKVKADLRRIIRDL